MDNHFFLLSQNLKQTKYDQVWKQLKYKQKKPLQNITNKLTQFTVHSIVDYFDWECEFKFFLFCFYFK